MHSHLQMAHGCLQRFPKSTIRATLGPDADNVEIGMEKMIVLIVAGLLGACAAQQNSPRNASSQANLADRTDPQTLQEIRLNARNVPVAAVRQESEVVCERVARTGSFIPRQRCMTREARRLETEQAQEWLRSDGTRGAISEVR